MSFQNHLAIAVGRFTYKMMRLLGKQASSLPGKIALTLSRSALSCVAEKRRIVCITGTNGKTTTTSIATDLLRAQGMQVTTNHSGANLANGLMTSMMTGKEGGITVLEVDEAALAATAADLNPEAIVVTNIFADQLDRYGSTDAVLELIRTGCSRSRATLILCADDPRVAAIGSALPDHQTIYFSADEKEGQRADAKAEEEPCPLCRHKLSYEYRTIRHLGKYDCPACRNRPPEPRYRFWRRPAEHRLTIADLQYGVEATVSLPLDGLYNAYNACAAVALTGFLLPAVSLATLMQPLADVRPQFGRLERFDHNGKELCMLLIKNAAGMEECVRLVTEQADIGGLLFVLNNRPADGEDVSWIWDADLENMTCPDIPFGCSGTKREEMADRLDAWCMKTKEIVVSDDPLQMTMEFLDHCPPGQCIYVMPNYTAMLSLRAGLAEKMGFDGSWE